MSVPPRNQFELSELEERTPKDLHTQWQDRRALSIDNRARVQHMLADDAASEPLPRPTRAQAREFGPLLAAALRRLVAECDTAIREGGRIDQTQLVRVALSVATKALRDASTREEECDGLA